MTKPVAVFALALDLVLGFCPLKVHAEADQTTAPLGQFFDPDNLENINKAQEGAQTAREAMQAKKLYSQGNYSDMAKNIFLKYQNSKVGLMTLLRKVQQKVSDVLTKASERVDKWRTTVPKLRAYAHQAIRYADDSYDFAKTFEMSDLWDIDRNFSKEMEWRLQNGRRLGLSFYDFLVSRVDRKEFLGGIQDLLFPDYLVALSKSARGGFVYLDAPSESEKVPIYVLHESLDVLNTVQQMAEAEMSPAQDAPGLTQQQFTNRRIRDALFDPKSGFTDQASIRQDILNQEYEIATRRSMLRDKLAELDLLWGQLAAQKLEAKERTTKQIATEAAKLSGTGLSPSEWIYTRFGLEDKP